jgi:hypothetical protein
MLVLEHREPDRLRRAVQMMYNFDILYCSVQSSVTYGYVRLYEELRTYVRRTDGVSLARLVRRLRAVLSCT